MIGFFRNLQHRALAKLYEHEIWPKLYGGNRIIPAEYVNKIRAQTRHSPERAELINEASREMLKKFLDSLYPSSFEPKSILAIAIGRGEELPALINHLGYTPRILACDISDHIEHASNTLNQAGIDCSTLFLHSINDFFKQGDMALFDNYNIVLVKGDAVELIQRLGTIINDNQKFDAVQAIECLIHFDVPPFLHLLKKVLVKDGPVLLTELGTKKSNLWTMLYGLGLRLSVATRLTKQATWKKRGGTILNIFDEDFDATAAYSIDEFAKNIALKTKYPFFCWLLKLQFTIGLKLGITYYTVHMKL